MPFTSASSVMYLKRPCSSSDSSSLNGQSVAAKTPVQGRVRQLFTMSADLCAAGLGAVVAIGVMVLVFLANGEKANRLQCYFAWYGWFTLAVECSEVRGCQ